MGSNRDEKDRGIRTFSAAWFGGYESRPLSGAH